MSFDSRMHFLLTVYDSQGPEAALRECAEGSPERLEELRRRMADEQRLHEFFSEQRDSPLSPPAVLNGYELGECRGRGHYGVVYRARHPRFRGPLAVKVLHPGRTRREAMFREATTAAQLKHPNIVPVHDWGEAEGWLFIVSAFIEGETLAERADRRPLPPHEAARIGLQLADALAHAHERNVYHRDVKLENVILDHQGGPHLTDFGLAVRVENLPYEGTQVRGTRPYLPPEQLGGRVWGSYGRADIYSLGVLLYRLLSGRFPFADLDEIADLRREARPIGELGIAVPEALDRICLKCLKKSPDERYASATGLRDALRRFLDMQADRSGGVSSLWNKRRWPLGVAAGIGAMLVASAVIAVVLIGENDPQERISPPQDGAVVAGLAEDVSGPAADVAQSEGPPAETSAGEERVPLSINNSRYLVSVSQWVVVSGESAGGRRRTLRRPVVEGVRSATRPTVTFDGQKQTYRVEVTHYHRPQGAEEWVLERTLHESDPSFGEPVVEGPFGHGP